MKYFLTACVLTWLAGGPALGDEEELIWQNGKWVRQATPAEGTAAGEAAIVRRDLDGKDYGNALKHAERFLKRYPNDDLREEVLGSAGDAELGRGNCWQAYEWYEKQLKEFPNGPRLERTLGKELEVAGAFLAGKKRVVAKVFRLSAEDEGIEILHRIAEHAPGSASAENALLTVGDHYYQKRDWADAVGAYDNFLKLFPKSARAAHAELRCAHALRISYRGPLWDETPLIEAEQRYRNFLLGHPATAGEANVEQILRDIHTARAEKQFEVGRFYVRTGKKPAAAQYFNLVAEQYSDTPWAPKAEAELIRLGQPRSAKGAPASQPAPGGKEIKP